MMAYTPMLCYHAEDLLDCFKNCSFFGWCCKEENSAFWRCYEQERVRHTHARLLSGCNLHKKTFREPMYCSCRAAVPQRWAMPCPDGLTR